MQKLTEQESEMMRDLCRVIIANRPVKLDAEYWSSVVRDIRAFTAKYKNDMLCIELALGFYHYLERVAGDMLKSKEHDIKDPAPEGTAIKPDDDVAQKIEQLMMGGV